jgi:outer membrane protein assembly factor BamB
MWSKELRKHYAFSTEDGSYMWETDSEHWLDAYGWGNMEHTWYFAYGKLFSVGVGGILYAYDDQTGDIVWTYELTDPYRESVAGNRWWGWIGLIADGKVYLGHLEHSAEQPIPRGAPFVCLNETTGDVIWRVNGMFRQTRWGGCAVIGDSIIATMDTYDQRIYAIGKGPSATSVAASPKVSVHGSSVLVEGMVTDISAGTKDDALTARFPNGVAAVSDDSMSDWMLYVYKQFQYPTNATGVEVTLDTVDPNGNWIHIGTVTSDSSGMFSCQWKPEVPGKYTVIATFAGSESYWASYAETAIGVDEAPPATPPPAYPQPIDPTWTIVAIGIAIIIAVAIVGVLMLRKRP